MGYGFPPRISLKAARMNAGLMQDVAAKKLGVSANTLRSWERGDTSPDMPKAMEISDLYQYPLDFIFFGKSTLKVSSENREVPMDEKSDDAG